MSTSPISPVTNLPTPTTPTPAQATGTAGLANENTFLKLLVAQLKNQDPLNPQDGTQFVAQLAQFSGLEQTIQIRQDLDTIKGVLKTPPATSTDPANPTTPKP